MNKFAIEAMITETQKRIALTKTDGEMHSACGEYNCYCHYEMTAYGDVVRQLLDQNAEFQRELEEARQQCGSWRRTAERLEEEKRGIYRVV